ncbi:hypothetical protein OYC64_005563 [Pagothenia borchgrevinki]|uniref:Paraneoplastic antigen Ma-like C-terminal domain-containing protein n=1 Tax=Pagothenia borchgrevinki TaxID=8213 RepID=A0ABD2GG34_PAGBO
MEVIKAANINIQNSIIINGSPKVQSDKELDEHLKQYGSIAKMVSIDAPNTKFHEHVIVEYTDDTAMQTLKPLLPGTFQPDVETLYHLRALADVYAPEISSTTTETVTGKTLEELAKLKAASGDAPTLQRTDEALETDSTQNVIRQVHSSPDSHDRRCEHKLTATPLAFDGEAARPAIGVKNPSSLRIYDVNPPEIQRVVVEHIVRNAEASYPAHTSNRIRSFSGKCPYPSSEVDYDTWRANLELILKDPAISDLHRARKILEILLSPTADIVKQLGPHASPADYLQLLDSAFGTVDDGEELFAKFMNMLQDAGEKPSHYLNRLQVILSQAVKRAPAEQNEHLLRQFCRGCWDSAMLTALQLDQRRHNPPSFPEVLLLLRTEEERQAAKAVRMRQHLGAPRQQAQIPE